MQHRSRLRYPSVRPTRAERIWEWVVLVVALLMLPGACLLAVAS